MSASNITHHRRTATSITSRLAALTLPAGLKPAAKRFTAAAMPLEPGDHLLFAGTRAARFAQNLTLDNRNVLDYVLTGHDAPGWLWRLLSRRASGRAR